MKRMTWFVAALATLCLTGQVRAQSTGTRVAIVNIGVVFTKYEKAKTFKTELETALKPFKEEAEKIKKNILAYQDGLTNPKYTDKDKEGFAKAIRDLKRQLEDLDLEARKRIGKKQEDHMLQLYKEVAQHIQAVASANGIHLVLGYGDPPDADLMTFPNINRKLAGMDGGALVPLFFHSSLDISEVVVTSLNRSYTGATNVTPTGLQK